MPQYSPQILISALSCLFILISNSQFVSAQSQIININSRSNSPSNPVRAYIEAGTYIVEPIGTVSGGNFNAWTAWSSRNCSDS